MGCRQALSWRIITSRGLATSFIATSGLHVIQQVALVHRIHGLVIVKKINHQCIFGIPKHGCKALPPLHARSFAFWSVPMMNPCHVTRIRYKNGSPSNRLKSLWHISLRTFLCCSGRIVGPTSWSHYESQAYQKEFCGLFQYLCLPLMQFLP